MFLGPTLTGPAIAQLMQQTDLQQSWTIQSETIAQAQRQQADRWKLQADTQTKIFEIQQDVTVQRARTQEKMYDHWDSYIRG